MKEYIGIPFSEKNCADLAIDIQREVYLKNVPDYERPEALTPFGYAYAIRKQLPDFTKQIEVEENGCLVLMRCRNRISHIGTLFYQGNVAYVLHTAEAFGSSVAHRLRDLSKYGYIVTGFYRWL